jgi:CubicO group peptidase (beta-lactamase class C family)
MLGKSLLALLLSSQSAPPHARESQPSSCSANALARARQANVVVGKTAQEIDEFVDRLAHLGVFSGQVLIARHDSVLLNGAYGFANLALCAPVTRETVFDIASLSKQFTGAALLRLAEDGALSLSDSLGKWLPDVPADKRGITIDQLSRHRAGIPRYLDADDFDHFAHDFAPPRDSVVRAILALPLRFAPGSQFEYSNMGFVLLAAIVERAARQPFTQYLRSAILRRAHLSRTAFPADTRTWPETTVARAYADLYDDGSPRERPDSWHGLGGSQIVSSATDLLTWHRALRTNSVLASDPRERLRDSLVGDYALGWRAVRRPDGTVGVFFHAGVHPRSFGSEFRYYPARDVVVIVLSNLRHDDVYMQEDVIANVSDYFVGRDSVLTPLPAVRPEATARIEGSYAISEGDSLIVWRDTASRLWLAPVGQRAFDIVFARDSTGARAANAAARTRGFIESLRQLDCAVPPAEPQVRTYEIRSAQWNGRWCAWQRDGAYRGMSIVGVAPRTYSKTRAYVVSRLQFGSTSRVVAWEWDGDEFQKSWSAPNVRFPHSRALAATAEGRFVVYDWFTGRRLDVNAQRDGAGRVTTLTLTDSTRSVVARR